MWTPSCFGLDVNAVIMEAASPVAHSAGPGVTSARGVTDEELDTKFTGNVRSRIAALVFQEMLGGKLTRLDARVGCPGAPSRVAVLVKLAVKWAIRSRKPVQLLATDSCRIVTSLAQVQEEGRHNDRALIDTPSLSRNEKETANDLACVLAGQPSTDAQLVLRASFRTADSKPEGSRDDVFCLRKLFMQLDDTETLGAILCVSVRMEPILLLSSGQRVIEDSQPAPADVRPKTIVRRGWTQGSVSGVVAL